MLLTVPTYLHSQTTKQSYRRSCYLKAFSITLLRIVLVVRIITNRHGLPPSLLANPALNNLRHSLA